MYLDLFQELKEPVLTQWRDFLHRMDLEPEPPFDVTALLREDDGTILGCGSRSGRVLKCIALDPARQGEGLLSTLLTPLRQNALEQGYSHLFVYTKPGNQRLFEPLFFYPVAKTRQVLLMESRKGGIRSFLRSLDPGPSGERVGAIVMNADPFTLGHRYLISQAAQQCDVLHVFVLSEDRGCFSARDRMEMVRRGTAELTNVRIHPTGDYLISAATFPGYFLKGTDTAPREHGLLDVEVFTRYFVPHFSITHRFAGTEPNCPVTARYNDTMARHLPERGVAFCQIPRLTWEEGAVSAGTVRSRIREGLDISRLVPETTYQYLKELHRI